MPNRLLLADEDPKTSRVLEVSLRGAGFDVTTVTTGAAAWVAIEQELPQVVIADTNLAALDGFELCARVRAREGGRHVAFILLGADDSLAYRIKSIEAGADDYLLKPPYVQEVLARVRAQIQRRDRETFTSSARAAEAFSGSLSDLKVVDLLQVIADSRRSGIIHLRGARDAPATIYFRQGQVVDAEVGRLSGLNAISRLFSWKEGSFEVQWKPIRRPNAIGLPTPELVIEGMKRLDQRSQLAGGLPDLNAVFEVNYRVLAERLSEIPDEVNAVLRLFDGSRTLAHVVEDCQLPDPEAMAIAIRLRDEGIIQNVSRPGAAERAQSLVVPRRPAGADDVTVVRRITSLGTGTGPLQALGADGTFGAPAAQTVVAPMPVPSSSFDEVDGVLPPAHHAKTDPGVGKPLGLPDLDPSGRSAEYALVETGAVVATSVADASASARLHEQPTGPYDIGDTAPPTSPEIQRRLTEPVDPLAYPEEPPAADHSAPDAAAVSTSRTALGLGPFPELFNEHAAHAAPSLEAADLPDEIEPESPPAMSVALGSEAAANGMSAALDAAPELSPEDKFLSSEPEEAPAGHVSGPAKTLRVNFIGEELSAQEALDELGVPGRKRGVAIVVAIAAVGALAAVAVHKLRPGAVATVQKAATAEHNTGAAPLAGEGAPAHAVGEAPAPPAPVAKAEPVVATPPPAADKPTGEAVAAVANKAEPARSDEPTTAAERAPPQAEKSAGLPSGKAVAQARAAGGAEKDAAPRPNPTAAEAAVAQPVDFQRQLATCRRQFLRDQLRDAGTSCAAALEANPRSADALTMMAHVELNRGHLGRANDLAQKSIAIDPNQADAYVIIGGVHQDSGRNAQAKVAYRRYLELAPHGRYAAELRSIVGSL